MAVRPGDCIVVSETDPLKLFREITEITLVFDVPWPTLIGFGAAVTLKSTTIRVNIME